MAKIFWIPKFITSFVSSVTELDLLVQELSAAQQKWEDIGRELGVEQDKLRDIRTNSSDPGDSLRMMLREKLKRHCIVWKQIIAVLRSSCVGEFHLADHLEAKCYPSELYNCSSLNGHNAVCSMQTLHLKYICKIITFQCHLS